MKQAKVKIIMPSSHKKKKIRSTDISINKKEIKRINVIDYKRNEAIGIILIGFGIFSITVFYYLNSSNINLLANRLLIHFGSGVYILPILVIVLGIQLFANKYYGNLKQRIVGIVLFLISCIGILNTEGGKIGIWINNSLESVFGGLPTKLLLFFSCLASLIYALDILYKDFIGYSLQILGIVIKLLLYFWEIIVYFAASLINVVDTTVKGLVLAYYKVKENVIEFYQEKELQDQSLLKSVKNFIPFIKINFQDKIYNITPCSGIEAKTTLLSLSHITPSIQNSNINSLELIDDSIANQEKTATTKSVAREVNNCSDYDQSIYSNNSTTIGQTTGNTNQRISNLIVNNIFDNSFTNYDFPNVMEPSVAIKTNSLFCSNEILDLNTLEFKDNQSNIPNFYKLSSANNNDINCEKFDQDDKNITNDNVDDHKVEINRSLLDNEIQAESNKYNILSTANEKTNTNNNIAETKPYELEKNNIDYETLPKNSNLSIKNALQEEEIKVENKPKLPPLDLLKVPPPKEDVHENDLKERSELLLKTFEEFGIKAQITDIVIGPTVSRFEIRPAPGIKVSKITSLVNEIAMALAAPAIRIEAPIPGKSAVGIEIPNPKPTPVYFYELVKNENFRSSKTLLNLALGMSINRRPVYADLTEMPHLLIAGATGAGKSVCINTIIASILYQATAEQVKMVMIDPKMVELSGYNGIPHLISPVVTDPKKAANALQWAVEEMLRRYEFLSSVKSRNINDYNQELPRLRKEYSENLKPMPLIVIIIDELADLMMTSSAQVESAICRLSQMSRAVGIHLVIATQRPSVDVITGLIKANLPSRIAFYVTSQVDSRTILDEKGAEKLLGKGDMLFKFKGRPMPIRIQGAYISDQELRAITEFVKKQGQPEYIDIEPSGKDLSEFDQPQANIEDDNNDNNDSDAELLNKVLEYLSTQEKTSTSMLQRKFKIGYNRAARIMDILEEKGIVSPQDGSNKRKVLKRSI